MKYALAAFAVGTAAASTLADVTLSGVATVDNVFQAFVSTSPTDPGPTPWLTGNNWPTPSSGSIDITAAGTYYLHVFAQDLGRPEMFLGRFTLSSTDGVFSNGTQTLLTNTTDWVVSNVGFGVSTTAPLALGPNGTGPWGLFVDMPGADFIWAPEYANGIAYFSTQFTVVPAPGAAAIVAGGLLMLGRRRR
jgi:hypothetical protein